MNRITKCYLAAVLSKDGQKVQQITVDSREMPIPEEALLGKNRIETLKNLKERMVMMSCNLSKTVIFNSLRRQEDFETILRAKKELEKVKFNAKEQEKMMRWFDKRNEKWELLSCPIHDDFSTSKANKSLVCW
jgi:rRNA maturation protein Rpf1